MADPTGYIHAAKEGGRSARVEAKSDANPFGYPALLRFGKINEALVDGAYKVDVLDDAGNVVSTLDYVLPIPKPAAAFSVGNIVWLVQWPGNPQPVIQTSGGGGGTCYAAVTAWGTLFGGAAID